jgi:hypothetical protein
MHRYSCKWSACKFYIYFCFGLKVRLLSMQWSDTNMNWKCISSKNHMLCSIAPLHSVCWLLITCSTVIVSIRARLTIRIRWMECVLLYSFLCSFSWRSWRYNLTVSMCRVRSTVAAWENHHSKSSVDSSLMQSPLHPEMPLQCQHFSLSVQQLVLRACHLCNWSFVPFMTNLMLKQMMDNCLHYSLVTFMIILSS